MKPSRALIAKWYAKLAKAGFKDAEEQFRNGDMQLKQYHSSLQFQVSTDKFLANQAYFDVALTFLNEHKFTTKADKQVWELYATGSTEVDIAKQLKFTRGRVNSILRKLRKECYGSQYPTAKGQR